MKTQKVIAMLAGAVLGHAMICLQPVRAQTAQKPPRSSCVECHLEIDEDHAAIVKSMEEDVHARKGLSCHDCHGGDPTVGFDGDFEASMDPAKGYIGKPERTDIPVFCARCHSDPAYMRRFNPRVSTDQYDRYKTSIHGQRIAQGDTKVATCVDCHGVHGVLEVGDPRAPVYATNLIETCARCHADPEYMREYNIPTNQVEQYRTSVHGVALLEKSDLAAPACNDCHGNHGASPPGLPSISYVCGQCHLNNAELFWKSPHNEAFKENDLPECETCHGNHDIQKPTDAMLGVEETSICIACHDEESRGYQVAEQLRADIENLKRAIARADSLVSLAARAGMEVSDGVFKLSEARDNLIKARTLIHSLDHQVLEKNTSQGLAAAQEAYEVGVAALDELQFRRRGLILSVVFIGLLATGLYLKIKEVDRRTMGRPESRE